MGSAESVIDTELIEQHLETLAEALPPGTRLTLVARSEDDQAVRSNDELDAAVRAIRRVQRTQRRERERPPMHAPATSSFDPRQ